EPVAVPKYIWISSSYTPKQVGRFLDLCKNQGIPIQEAASRSGIKKQAAYDFYNESLRNPTILLGYRLVSQVHHGNNHKIKERHRIFLNAIITKRPTITIDEIHYRLSEAFPDLLVHPSSVHRYMTKKMELSSKRLRLFVSGRNSPSTRMKR
ncbi:hypothetical protein BJV82DRAFT_491738, partial [Fennellomyces sp. T-0311]